MSDKFRFVTSCVGLMNQDVQPIYDMIDRARAITWRTLIRHVDAFEVRDLFPHYDWNGRGLHIKDDWAVSFHKSRYKGKPCFYIRHSAIEYIFCPAC